VGEDGRHCRRCGSRLARDHEDDEWCTPCLELRRIYDPTIDPHFVLALLAVLQAAEGQRVEPLKALGLEPRYGRFVRSQIRALRRLGYDIHSCGERCTGYRYAGRAVVSCASDVRQPA